MKLRNRSRCGQDPYWTKARFNSKCSGCHAEIRKGKRIYYYPNDRSVFCEECGQEASQDFNGAAFDEGVYNGRF